MTVKEAAKRLELHPSSVYDIINAGDLPARRIGPKRGKIVIDEADVEAYWRKAKVLGGAAPKAAAAPQQYKYLKPPA
jgi:excisionase family DNA binding protein